VNGTARYVSRFTGLQAAGFFRSAADFEISSLGLGTYLGKPDDATDRAYSDAVTAAVRAGINFLDAAINYRNQRSERSIGAALASLFAAGEFTRDELAVCTKAGFLTPGAVPSFLQPSDVVGGMHSIQPDFLADQIDRSRANLGLDALDVFYLHNPETQLDFVARAQFEERIRAAFARLEKLAAEGKIRYYGTATWNGYREAGKLDLARLLEIAAAEGGAQHHFRFVQLPFNLGMVEAMNQKPESVLRIAQRSGITVVASASLLQARLTRDLPEAIGELIPGLATDAQRAIQFTRSTPGITVALVGMSKAGHVAENMGVATVPPLTADEYGKLLSDPLA
jgi:aryl-alcohol dehydrogenase-like predicted oxidoreductase